MSSYYKNKQRQEPQIKIGSKFENVEYSNKNIDPNLNYLNRQLYEEESLRKRHQENQREEYTYYSKAIDSQLNPMARFQNKNNIELAGKIGQEKMDEEYYKYQQSKSKVNSQAFAQPPILNDQKNFNQQGNVINNNILGFCDPYQKFPTSNYQQTYQGKGLQKELEGLTPSQYEDYQKFRKEQIMLMNKGHVGNLLKDKSEHGINNNINNMANNNNNYNNYERQKMLNERQIQMNKEQRQIDKMQSDYMKGNSSSYFDNDTMNKFIQDSQRKMGGNNENELNNINNNNDNQNLSKTEILERMKKMQIPKDDKGIVNNKNELRDEEEEYKKYLEMQKMNNRPGDIGMQLAGQEQYNELERQKEYMLKMKNQNEEGNWDNNPKLNQYNEGEEDKYKYKTEEELYRQMQEERLRNMKEETNPIQMNYNNIRENEQYNPNHAQMDEEERYRQMRANEEKFRQMQMMEEEEKYRRMKLDENIQPQKDEREQIYQPKNKENDLRNPRENIPPYNKEEEEEMYRRNYEQYLLEQQRINQMPQEEPQNIQKDINKNKIIPPASSTTTNNMSDEEYYAYLNYLKERQNQKPQPELNDQQQYYYEQQLQQQEQQQFQNYQDKEYLQKVKEYEDIVQDKTDVNLSNNNKNDIYTPKVHLKSPINLTEEQKKKYNYQIAKQQSLQDNRNVVTTPGKVNKGNLIHGNPYSNKNYNLGSSNLMTNPITHPVNSYKFDYNRLNNPLINQGGRFSNIGNNIIKK